jgi:hypothetical protein
MELDIELPYPIIVLPVSSPRLKASVTAPTSFHSAAQQQFATLYNGFKHVRTRAAQSTLPSPCQKSPKIEREVSVGLFSMQGTKNQGMLVTIFGGQLRPGVLNDIVSELCFNSTAFQ